MRNLIAAFSLGALAAGAGAYFAIKSAAEPAAPAPASEVIVAQVDEPKKETLPAAYAAGAASSPAMEETKPTPRRERQFEAPRAPVSRFGTERSAEKPAPRAVPRPDQASPGVSVPAPAPVIAREVPRVEATPAPAAPVVQNEPNVFRPDPVQPPAKKRDAQTVAIKEGTVLTIRTSEVLSSERLQSGDNFTAALAEPIVVDGFVLAERGARVTGRIVEALAAGKVKGVARLSMELTQVTLIDGQKLALATDPFLREGSTSKKGDAAKVGAGAAIGAALGGIFGGGKGAAIGGAAGAGAGGGAVILTRGKPVEIESESRLPFRLNRTLSVTEKL